MARVGGLSEVEGVKRASRGLRGGLAAAAADAAPAFSGGDATLLKFHGVYQGTATARPS